MSRETLEAELNCAHCHQETLHELVYAGRLLVSTTCSVCNTRVEHETNDLWDIYLKDLWRSFRRSPSKSFWALPKATFGKPFKMIKEYRNLKKKSDYFFKRDRLFQTASKLYFLTKALKISLSFTSQL